MKEYCSTDLRKINNLCGDNISLYISFTDKGKKEMNNAKNDEFQGKELLKPEYQRLFDTEFNNLLNTTKIITSDEVEASMCATSEEGYEVLGLLLSSNKEMNDSSIVPSTTIYPVEKGECKKFVDKTFLKEKLVPKETFREKYNDRIAIKLNQYQSELF